MSQQLENIHANTIAFLGYWRNRGTFSLAVAWLNDDIVIARTEVPEATLMQIMQMIVIRIATSNATPTVVPATTPMKVASILLSGVEVVLVASSGVEVVLAASSGVEVVLVGSSGVEVVLVVSSGLEVVVVVTLVVIPSSQKSPVKLGSLTGEGQGSIHTCAIVTVHILTVVDPGLTCLTCEVTPTGTCEPTDTL